MLFTNMSTSTTVGLTVEGGEKKHKLLRDTFHSGSTLDSFQAQERQDEAGSMGHCCSEASEE